MVAGSTWNDEAAVLGQLDCARELLLALPPEQLEHLTERALTTDVAPDDAVATAAPEAAGDLRASWILLRRPAELDGV